MVTTPSAFFGLESFRKAFLQRYAQLITTTRLSDWDLKGEKVVRMKSYFDFTAISTGHSDLVAPAEIHGQRMDLKIVVGSGA